MEDTRVEALLADLELTRQEEGLLRHLTGQARLAPRGFWGRFSGEPLGTLKTREALLFLVGLVVLSVIPYLLLWKWPFLGSALPGVAMVLVCWTLIGRQQLCDRLALKLYQALEKARASTPEIREPLHPGTPDGAR